ncbi:DnaD domain-containing protein [Alicyclobacillus macrosporangiidus]|uniref:Replication initiation and membrane attachment n=1 Tax=Alicyclobacillus macrosporangiidus TaxID=392015 RepID=A0A1I7IBZ9_9BACL|nr:DnaD domain protein [Alicyclobacillus macrosporangiidus]SFU70471.1 Replication initiation and membrane attachment [Alicyclobacillus macrosporangiidus]
MAWIESHETLAHHPKTRKLARLLGEDLPATIGRLHLLWWWAMNYAQDGDLTKYDDSDIADALMWSGDPGHAVEALCTAGFLDRTEDGLYIHDWQDYAGRLIVQREKNAERKRRSRARHADVTRTDDGQECDGRESHGATIPNLTKPDLSGGGDHAHAREIVRAYEQIYGTLPNPVQIDDLVQYVEQGMEVGLVITALRRSRVKGKDLEYALGILRRQLQRGIRTVAQAEMDDARFELAIKARAPTETKPRANGEGGVNRGVDWRSDGADVDWDAIEERFFGGG